MLRFPINWEITLSSRGLDGEYENIHELILNKEWKIECVLKADCFSQEVDTFKMCRQTTSEEVLISGSLSYPFSRKSAKAKEFSKLIAPESSFITMDLRPVLDCFFGRDPHYSGKNTLIGIVYIMYISEICGKNSAIGECKGKCSHLQTLVQLSNDFERLLDPQTACNTDVNLKCGDKLIPAHKDILSARSPVFAAMFANEMKEKHEKQVNVIDMGESVVRALMAYIYTGKTFSLTISSTANLLYAADKYQLEDLKKVCCDFLKERISLQNVVKILLLGDLHAKDLKSFAMDYICNRSADFSVLESSEEWKILRKQRADLAMDVMASLVKLRI